MRQTENEKLLKIFLADIGIRNAYQSGPYDYSCQCPLHDDQNPSFAISFHPRRWGLWTCYGCGAKGTFTDLSDYLGSEIKIEAPVPPLSEQLREFLQPEIDEPDIQYPEPSLLGEQQAVQYLTEKRNYRQRIAEQLVETFGMYRGTKEWSRYLIFPILNENRNLIGFTSRNLTSLGPKNRHPAGADKSQWLFGIHVCLEEYGLEEVILTEGPFDALRLHAYGFPAVATLGAPTRSQITKTATLFGRVYTAFDGDESGKKYRDKVKNQIPSTHFQLPPGKDPDELTENQWNRVWSSRPNQDFSQRIRKLLRTVIGK